MILELFVLEFFQKYIFLQTSLSSELDLFLYENN